MAASYRLGAFTVFDCACGTSYIPETYSDTPPVAPDRRVLLLIYQRICYLRLWITNARRQILLRRHPDSLRPRCCHNDFLICVKLKVEEQEIPMAQAHFDITFRPVL